MATIEVSRKKLPNLSGTEFGPTKWSSTARRLPSSRWVTPPRSRHIPVTTHCGCAWTSKKATRFSLNLDRTLQHGLSVSPEAATSWHWWISFDRAVTSHSGKSKTGEMRREILRVLRLPIPSHLPGRLGHSQKNGARMTTPFSTIRFRRSRRRSKWCLVTIIRSTDSSTRMSVTPSLRAAATASSGAIPTYCTASGGGGRLSWAILPIIAP